MKICCNKKCSHKKAPQPEKNFYRNPMTKDGLCHECKTCRRERGKKCQEKARQNYFDSFSMFIG
jgi:hypothetical protein